MSLRWNNYTAMIVRLQNIYYIFSDSFAVFFNA